MVKRARKRLCCVPDERLKQKERDTDECAPAVMTRGEEGVVERWVTQTVTASLRREGQCENMRGEGQYKQNLLSVVTSLCNSVGG